VNARRKLPFVGRQGYPSNHLVAGVACLQGSHCRNNPQLALPKWKFRHRHLPTDQGFVSLSPHVHIDISPDFDEATLRRVLSVGSLFVFYIIDATPLYRQQQQWKRLGIDLGRPLLSSWVVKYGTLLLCLWELMRQDIQASDYVQADETPVQVLHEAVAMIRQLYMVEKMAKARMKRDSSFTFDDRKVLRLEKLNQYWIKSNSGWISTRTKSYPKARWAKP